MLLLDHESFPHQPYTLNVTFHHICNSWIRAAMIFSQSKLFLTSLDATCSLSLPTPDSSLAHSEIVGALSTGGKKKQTNQPSINPLKGPF